jgi:hippurate hydrolase
MGRIGDDINLITATTLSGGGAHNIIPDRVELTGTIRCLSSEKRAQFHQALKGFERLPSDGVIHVRIEPASPSVFNHEGLESIAQSSIRDTLGESGIVPLLAPNMASEDFGFYTQAFPGWFYRIGARPIGEDFIPVHTPGFIADEKAIFIGASVLAKSAQLGSQSIK